MGDRVLMQCHGKDKDFGAVVYCHWDGGSAPGFVKALAHQMADRPGDIEYATARLAQIVTRNDKGSTGYGIQLADHLLTAEDTHGDAGVVLINVDDGFKVTCLGGYLKATNGRIDCDD